MDPFPHMEPHCHLAMSLLEACAVIFQICLESPCLPKPTQRAHRAFSNAQLATAGRKKVRGCALGMKLRHYHSTARALAERGNIKTHGRGDKLYLTLHLLTYQSHTLFKYDPS